MLSLLALAALASADQIPAAVGGLQGCWKASGQVLGKDATSVARGEWHLGRRYFMLHLRSVARKEPYEASLVYGAGDRPGAITAFWMDSFGGAYSTAGKGAATSDGFNVVYTYPDSAYTNRFSRSPKGWQWTIVEEVPGKPAKVFAKYDLRRANCRGIKFQF